MMRSLSELLSTLEAQIGSAGLVSLLFGLAALLGLIFGMSLMGALGASRQRRALRESTEEQELLQNLLNDTRLHGSRMQSENDVLKAEVSSASERETKHDREVRQLTTELKAAQMSLETKDSELSKKNGLLEEQSVAASGAEANQQALSLAVQEAIEKGRSEGLETGLKNGFEQGRSEGLVAGRQEAEKKEAAANALRNASLRTPIGHTASPPISPPVGPPATAPTSSPSNVSESAVAIGSASVAAASAAMAAAKSSEPPTLIKKVQSQKEGSLSTAETGIIPDDQIIPTLPEAELTANVEAYDLSDLEDLVSEDL